jgi:hypothetical protein
VSSLIFFWFCFFFSFFLCVCPELCACKVVEEEDMRNKKKGGEKQIERTT